VIQSLQLSFDPFTPEFKGPEAEGRKARKYFELKPGSFWGFGRYNGNAARSRWQPFIKTIEN
jgi:hypothetical protein